MNLDIIIQTHLIESVWVRIQICDYKILTLSVINVKPASFTALLAANLTILN